MQKNISFHINLGDARTELPAARAVAAALPASVADAPSSGEVEIVRREDLMSFVPSILPAKKVEKPVIHLNSSPKKDANLANTFANIGFIINPNYAKKKGIDPLIVAHHVQNCYQYVKTFAPIAQAEMKEHGIPASIKLAQGLLESDAGFSRLAKGNNNHFGIKCFSKSCKKNHCSNFTDDSHKDFFRKFPSANDSFRQHSLFLEQARYQSLKKLGKRNYKAWAHGLKAAGYATDKLYAEKIIKIIENMQLYRYDL